MQDAAPFVRLLCEMHEDLRAYLFLFDEVACASYSAVSCRGLLGCIWSDPAFWRIYGGPCVFDEPMGSSAELLRDTFRKWRFHLDGPWSKDFGDFVNTARQLPFGPDFRQLLADAKYIVAGLMPSDGGPAVEEFTETLRNLLLEYDPSQLDDRFAAEALVAKVEHRDDVFTEAQMSAVAAANDESRARAVFDLNLEDPALDHDTFLDPLGEESDQEVGDFPGTADAWEPPDAPPPVDSP